MKSSCFVLLIASGALVQASASIDRKPVHNINLIGARDIADAAQVNLAISVWSKDVSHCPANPPKDRQACACSFAQDKKGLEAAYAATVAKHPRWNEDDTFVAYRDAATGLSVSLNFPSIKRQLDACAQSRSPALSINNAAATVSGSVFLSAIPYKPVHGAKVILYDARGAGCFGEGQQWTFKNLPLNCLSAYKIDLAFSAETDSDGNFAIEKDIRRGKYFVLVFCKDCYTKEAQEAWSAARVEFKSRSNSENLQISNPGHVY